MEIAILECGHHFLRTLEKLEVCIIYKKRGGGVPPFLNEFPYRKGNKSCFFPSPLTKTRHLKFGQTDFRILFSQLFNNAQLS